jgi:hypothetical protein
LTGQSMVLDFVASLMMFAGSLQVSCQEPLLPQESAQGLMHSHPLCCLCYCSRLAQEGCW